MHAYHFGAGAVNKEKPAQDSPPKRYTSYVPDGLTQEEYMKIKSDEMAKQQKMNYGAWGPRFKLIDGDPDSNWFNLPSLWTSGFNSNPKGSTSADYLGDASTALAKLVLTLRRVLIPYMTLLLSIHLLETSLSAKNILRGKLLITKYNMMVKILAPLLVMKPLDFLATKLFRSDKDRATKLSIGIGLMLSAVSLVLRQRM